MLGGVMNLVSACWRPIEKYVQTSADVMEEVQEGLLWFKDIGKHVAGEFSMAVAQANNLVEDQCQVESTGPPLAGIFVGVYDGHGGSEAARFINDNLYRHFQKFALEQQGISADVIRKAFIATEEAFLSVVTNAWPATPQLASVGSCCLVGVIHERTLYVANLGDSRVVMGRFIRSTGAIAAVQLSTEHNASVEAVRQELCSLHPDDPQIVVLKHGVWRVKGIIQVSRSIGDVYLKRPEFNQEPLNARFRLPEPLERPVLTAEPSISTYTVQPNDHFLIFASDGLWEHLSNQDAVDIVHNHPRVVHMASSEDLVEIFGVFGSSTLEIPSTPINSFSESSLEASTSITSAENIGASFDFLVDEMLSISDQIIQLLQDENKKLECLEIEKAEKFQYAKQRFGIAAAIVEEYYDTLKEYRYAKPYGFDNTQNLKISFANYVERLWRPQAM